VPKRGRRYFSILFLIITPKVNGPFCEPTVSSTTRNVQLISTTKVDGPCSSSLLLSSPQLSDTQVYEPEIRALLGNASQFCDVVVLKLRTAPNGITLSADTRAQVPSNNPEYNPRANRWFLWSALIPMLHPEGSICGRLT